MLDINGETTLPSIHGEIAMTQADSFYDNHEDDIQDDDIPLKVKETKSFLKRYGIWHIISRNSPVKSCRDAANRRNRLGKEGINLTDELKSMCAVYYDGKGIRHYILLHCRANLRFDMNAIEKLLKASRPIARLAPDELIKAFGSEYGTVNPFIKMDMIYAQLFDKSITEDSFTPHTMMTNAGTHTWAVEFNPNELVRKLSDAFPDKIKVSDITIKAKDANPGKRFVLGLITGNGPDSGITLWKHFIRFVKEKLGDKFAGDLSYPPIIIHSIPEMGLSMELEQRESHVWEILGNGIRQLCEKGATHIALACHTTHYFTEKIRELCGQYNAEFVSMAETTIEFIKTQGIDNTTIIGIPYVSDLGKWSAYKELSFLDIQPVDEKAREPLLELGYWIKQVGSDNKGLSLLNHILRIGVKTESVLIALTEISVLLEGFPKKQDRIGQWKIIDPLLLYGQKLAQVYIDSISYLFNDSDSEDDFRDREEII